MTKGRKEIASSRRTKKINFISTDMYSPNCIVIAGGKFRAKGENKICRTLRHDHDKAGTEAQVECGCQHTYCRISHLVKCEMTTRYYLDLMVHVTLNMLIEGKVGHRILESRCELPTHEGQGLIDRRKRVK
jgi:hypothetical protein